MLNSIWCTIRQSPAVDWLTASKVVFFYRWDGILEAVPAEQLARFGFSSNREQEWYPECLPDTFPLD